MPNIDLRNCDCMELMAQYPDKYFDLAIVDPPYGINRSGQKKTECKNAKHNRKYFEHKEWDSKPPPPEYFAELFRVSKNQIIWGANYFVDNLKPSMGWIFWDKGQNLSMSDGELAYTSFNKALRRVTINRGVLAKNGGTIHPTEKPLELYEWVLRNYAKKGDLILDTHGGSFNSAKAAYNLGFDFVGCEIDTEYFQSAKKRFDLHSSQLLITL